MFAAFFVVFLQEFLQIHDMNLPEPFTQRMKQLLGQESDAFFSALASLTPVSIRMNNRASYEFPESSAIPWCENGYYLKERPTFTSDPLFHAGCYYVQEASSLFLQEIVRQFFPNANRVLDLCAAPGGKSTLLSQNLPDDCLLVSNEIVRTRAEILSENIQKWGNPNVLVSCNKPEHFGALDSFFDAIVVDAPCSGEGMFRKDPGAIQEWSVQNVQMCAKRQKNILSDVWSSLKPGGVLVYSTCTWNEDENENNVMWACQELGADLLQPDISNYHGIVQTEAGCRFYPHKVAGEGFFIAVMRKSTDNVHSYSSSRKSKKNVFTCTSNYNHYLKQPEKFAVVENNESVIAYHVSHFADILHLKEKLYFLIEGVQLFEKKGRDLIPTHQFALSKQIQKDAFEVYEVDYNEAIVYLKRENLHPEGLKTGFILVSYQHQVLGWIKNIGNRSNNLYPKHWKIRMNL